MEKLLRIMTQERGKKEEEGRSRENGSTAANSFLIYILLTPTPLP